MFRATLFIVLFSATLHAADLKGKVLDPDGKAVGGAHIFLFDRKSGEVRTTTGSSDGNYSFPGVSDGDYLVEGDGSSGALKGSMPVTISGDLTQDLKLGLTSMQTQVLVTASAVPLSVEEIAKAIDAIDSQELARRDELSIAEAVRTIPGVRVKVLEGPGSFTKIQTRGLRAQDTAVLIDGMRFHDAGSPQNDASVFLGSMMLADTDRIEFMRGSGSSLYGTNALAGVMNVTSNSGGGPMHSDLRVEGGGLGLVRGVLRTSGGLFSDRLTYSGAGSHVYMTNGVRDGLPYRNNGVQGTARFAITPKMSFTAREWYSNDYLTSTESPSPITAALPSTAGLAVPPEVKAIALSLDELKKYESTGTYTAGNANFIPNTIDPDGRKYGAYSNNILTFQHQPTSSTSYRVGYQSMDSRRTYLDGPKGRGAFDAFATPRSSFDGDIDTLQARLDQKAGRYNAITFGYEFERERYLSYDGPSQKVGTVAAAIENRSATGISNGILLKQGSHAFYAQDQISLMDSRLQVTIAARAQTFNVKQPVFQGFTTTNYSTTLSSIVVPTAYTGDGAIAYFVRSSRTKLRGHIGNSFRAPSGYERFGGGFGSYYGDPRLSPERSVAVDAGIDQWLFGNKAQLGATWFYTNLQQTILFKNSFTPGTDPFGRTFGGYANGGGGIARGLELSGSVSPRTGTKLRAAYTYVNSDQRTPTAGTAYYRVLDLANHVFSVTATQWIGSRTDVTFDLAAHSDYVQRLSGSSVLYKFNGPIKPDVVVTHRLPFGDDRRVEIYGKVENMFGQRPYESGFIGPKAWFTSGFRINY